MRILLAPAIAFLFFLGLFVQPAQAKQFSVFVCSTEASAVSIAEQIKEADKLPIYVKPLEDCLLARNGAVYHSDVQVSTWVPVWGPVLDADGDLFGVYRSMGGIYFVMWTLTPGQEV